VFLDEKNKISEEVKTLLRELLQMEPNDRISWESFFNHPVFHKELMGVSQNFISSEGQINKVNIEFQNNKQEILKDNNEPVDPMNLEAFIDPEIIHETLNLTDLSIKEIAESSKSTVDLVSVFKEYSFRYYHEKNKILLIFLTVKQLRQLMKEADTKELQKRFYLLMMILAKKGSELSELTILSLKMRNNIFKLEHFDSYCKETEEYLETLEQLKNDQQFISDYQKYIVGLKKDVDLDSEEQEIFSWTIQKFVDLKVLDDKAKTLYQKVRSLGFPLKTQEDSAARHFYLLTMIYTRYSIKTEVYLPYLTENSKFEWDTFKEKHENCDCDQLNQLLIKLES
jgi:hypothetical protein